MDSPEKLATFGTQDIAKTNKTNNMTQKQRRCATRTPQKPRREARQGFPAIKKCLKALKG
jgi:hypothetical protein